MVYESDAAKARRVATPSADAGGTIVKENAAIGVATVRSSDADFVRKRDGRGRAGRRRGRTSRSARASPAARRRRSRARASSAAGAGKAREGPEGRAARRQPVGHADDRRRRRSGSYRTQPGTRQVLVGIIDTGVDGIASGHRAELREVAARATSPTDMPDIDGPCEDGARPVLRGPRRRRRGRPRHARGGHRRRGAQRHRHRRRGPEDRHREPARRPGLGLLLPAADGRRPDVRGRQRDRRREHVVLHRSVALQLHAPTRPTRRRSRRSSAIDHRGHAARPALRARPRRDAGRGGRQPGRRPGRSGAREHEPGLPGRAPRPPARRRRTTCLSLPTEGDNVLVDQRARPEQAQVVLLQLRHLGRRTCRRRAATPATPRRRATPALGHPHPLAYPAEPLAKEELDGRRGPGRAT